MPAFVEELWESGKSMSGEKEVLDFGGCITTIHLIVGDFLIEIELF